MSSADSCLEAALAYLERGWSVIPIAPRDKRPLLRWRPFEAALADAATVRGWYARWPAANVAIVTGALSGLIVLDLDPRHEGTASLNDAEAELGALPPTVEAQSGGGGRHLYFRYPGRWTRNRVGLRPGLDLRGDGGCIVAPPSVHASGQPYRWRRGRSPGALAPAAAPAWLCAQAAPTD